jgi:hypothetical protein
MTEFVLVSSDETRYSLTVAEQSRVERPVCVSFARRCKQKRICPFEECVCCYMRDFTENFTGINKADGPYDVV